MLFKHAALGEEKVFGVFQNVEVSSFTTGYGVAYAVAAASFDGTKAIFASSAAAARQLHWVGIASKDISPNAYGPIQMFGMCASVFISNVGTSVTINTGDSLVPGALAGGLFCIAAPTWAASGFGVVVACSVNPAISAQGWVSGFVKKML
jgi:hypothetical protein